MGTGLSDTRVRVTTADLERLQLKHIYSEAEDALDNGYTEWSAAYTRALTFGWDWNYDRETGALVADWPQLRTNLMVTDAAGADLGPEQTSACVAQLAAEVGWQRRVADECDLALAPTHPR